MNAAHRPVLVTEVLKCLLVRPNGVYVDGTIGEGGHATAILQALGPQGRLIGLDRDAAVLEAARKRLEPFAGRFQLYHESYERIDDVLFLANVEKADGIVLDLGWSSFQVEDAERGFSFRTDAPLDMRFDRTASLKAEDLLREADAAELARIFRRFGEERWAGPIARAIVRARGKRPLRTTGQLVQVIMEAVPPHAGRRRIHPATRVFQALRIAVNRELERLERFLEQVESWIAPGGRLVVISYHSLEDRMVKHRMQDWNRSCTCPKWFPQCVCGGRKRFRILTPKPITPSKEEVEQNIRSRSARLRAAERI